MCSPDSSFRKSGADLSAAALPAISVVMPVYNAGRHLRLAIESVLAQTFANFEFLVCDDGSTDGSVDVAEGYARADPRVQLLRAPHEGFVSRLNAGLRAARGDLIARMDADDESLPERFERQHAFLHAHPDVVVVGTDYAIIDEDGDLLGIGRHRTEHDALVSKLLAGDLGVIGHPTAMMRRGGVLGVGGYRERYGATESDLDLWFRLAKVGKLANMPEVLFRYRQNARSITYTLRHVQGPLIDELVSAARAERGLAPLAPAPRPQALDEAARHMLWAGWALAEGSRKAAQKHARIATSLAPGRLQGWCRRAAAMLPLGIPRIAVRAGRWVGRRLRKRPVSR
jgi:hypothetical protein